MHIHTLHLLQLCIIKHYLGQYASSFLLKSQGRLLEPKFLLNTWASPRIRREAGKHMDSQNTWATILDSLVIFCMQPSALFPWIQLQTTLSEKLLTILALHIAVRGQVLCL